MRLHRYCLALFVLFTLGACSGEQDNIRSQVAEVEAELLKLATPVEDAHANFQTASAKLPTATTKALAGHLSDSIKPIVHDAAEKSLAADNKCFGIQKHVEASSLPSDIKAKLASVVFQHSRFYYCRWTAYETAEEAIDLLKRGKVAEYQKAMARAVESMNEGTSFQMEAVSRTQALNSRLGISSGQK